MCGIEENHPGYGEGCICAPNNPHRTMSKPQPEIGTNNTIVCNGVVAGWDVIEGAHEGNHYEDTMVSVMILDHGKSYRHYVYIRWVRDIDTVASIITQKILLKHIRYGWVTLQLLGSVIVPVWEAEEMLDAILSEYYIDFYVVPKGKHHERCYVID